MCSQEPNSIAGTAAHYLAAMTLTLGEAIPLLHALVADAAERSGTRALFIKGRSLDWHGLREPRIPADVDVLLPAGEVDALLAQLAEAGWRRQGARVGPAQLGREGGGGPGASRRRGPDRMAAPDLRPRPSRRRVAQAHSRWVTAPMAVADARRPVARGGAVPLQPRRHCTGEAGAEPGATAAPGQGSAHAPPRPGERGRGAWPQRHRRCASRQGPATRPGVSLLLTRGRRRSRPLCPSEARRRALPVVLRRPSRRTGRRSWCRTRPWAPAVT